MMDLISPADPVAIAASLIRCQSVTPHDGGAQAVIAAHLQKLGFKVTHLKFGEIENLFARIGSGSPHLCFAGHTDVVPVGGEWRHAPFAGEIEDGILYGRGACDMKGAIAAFMAAAAAYIQEIPLTGSISFLITGDEEGEAKDGTARVLEWMRAHDQIPDLCLVGEPTNPSVLGEMIKVGRRGSLNAQVIVRGTQGHVAYPQRADNPIHPLLRALQALISTRLDEGSAFFEASSLQITSVDVGNTASNVIPASAQAKLNIRFNDLHSGESLSKYLRECFEKYCADFDLRIWVSGESFITSPGEAISGLTEIITRITGRTPAHDTGGGTSDARFIARYCPVFEFGLVGASMHKIDEHVRIADLLDLAAIYKEFLAAMLAKVPA